MDSGIFTMKQGENMDLSLLRLKHSKNFLTIAIISSIALLSGKASAGSSEKGIASSYTDRYIASGARFDANGMTAAHKTYALGSRWTVYHGRYSLVVTINDRGPFVRGRILDLTPAANKALRCYGLCRVTIKPWPPLPTPAPGVTQTYAWGEEP